MTMATRRQRKDEYVSMWWEEAGKEICIYYSCQAWAENEKAEN